MILIKGGNPQALYSPPADMSITRRERKRKGVKSMDRNKKEPCGDMAQDEITEAKGIILKAKRLTKINKILTGLNLLIFLGYLAKFL